MPDNIRKVVVIRNSKNCFWFADFIALLQRQCDFKLTGKVRTINTVIGWMPADKIDVARALSEVSSISDDYPFLQQLDD